MSEQVEEAKAPRSLQVEVEGDTYEIPLDGFSLGELRLVKRLFSVEKFDTLDLSDVDVLAGLLFVAMRRAHPEIEDTALVRRVEAISEISLVQPEDGGVDADPTKPGEEDDPGADV